MGTLCESANRFPNTYLHLNNSVILLHTTHGGPPHAPHRHDEDFLRPVTVWILPDSAANEFHDRVSRIRSTARISNLKPLGALGGLGYRGFKVQALSATPTPPTSTPASSTSAATTPPTLPKTANSKSGSSPPTRSSSPADIQDHVERSFEIAVAHDGIILRQPFETCPVCHAADALPFDTGTWCKAAAPETTTTATTTPTTASRIPLPSPAKPAEISSPRKQLHRSRLRPCRRHLRRPPRLTQLHQPPPQPGRTVAVLWPGHDFHWYRH